ncbi:MAG TPA: Mut7-C RNAse domain-containing protein [Syntrophorhabdaceae bacterium]|nr:Mut7-C RNAse domain-containing protein [Syntrophorhabdaceae bacterium]
MKFICDVMLGKLSRYLRMLGFDAPYIKNYRELNRLIEGSESYYFFTRRTKDLPDGAVLVRSDHIKTQIEEVLSVIRPYFNEELVFCRCLNCNVLLMDVEKKDIEGKVPEFVYHRHDLFKTCPVCKKIYWGGTHTEHMEAFIKSILIERQPT